MRYFIEHTDEVNQTANGRWYANQRSMNSLLLHCECAVQEEGDDLTHAPFQPQLEGALSEVLGPNGSR